MFSDVLDQGFKVDEKITRSVFEPSNEFADSGKGKEKAVDWSKFDAKI